MVGKNISTSYDPKQGQLKYENFTILGLFLHLLGYKKEYTKDGLKNGLKGKKSILINYQVQIANHKKLQSKL